MRTVVIILTALLSTISQAQILTPEQLQEDFDLFTTALQEAHPGLYRYNSKEHIDSVFSETRAKLNTDMTREEFYRMMTPLVDEIKCGHTKFHPDENWTDNYYFNREKLFPFSVIFLGNKAYILSSYLPDSSIIPRGAELTAINNMPLDDVKKRLMKGLYSDGNNTTFKYLELGKFFSALYANLIGPSEEFEITYSFSGKEKTVKVPAVSSDQIAGTKIPESQQPWSFQIRNSVGILTVSSFAERSSKEFKKFLKETFMQIEDRNLNSLIIDIRNNEGGEDSRGALLISYLMNSPFRYYDHLEAATKKKISFSDNAYKPGFYGLLRTLLTKTDSGTVLWKHHKNLKTQKPQKMNYDGKVYVLINGASFSVTSEFAAVAHYLKRAVFIGEETGGGYYGNNSGTFVIAKLPNTRLNLGIPMLAYYTAVKNYSYPDHGVIPEYNITPRIEDIEKNHDPVMEFAMQLISNNN